MWFEPNRTQFDLNFRLFGIHVRVHPLFWLVTAILGSSPQQGIKYVLMWIAVVFVSILIHEMGHVLMGRIFGSFGHIVLYGLGGLAIGSSDLRKRWQRNLVYFAGPLAQFLLLGIIFLAQAACMPANKEEPSGLLLFLFFQLKFVNFFWPLLNLLPVWPLDGGKISRETFEWLMPVQGTGISLIVSLILAGALAIGAIWIRDMFLGLFFAMFAINNFQEWQAVRYQSRHPWENEEERW